MVLVDLDSVCSKLHVLQSCSEVMKLYTSVEASCAEICHCRVLDAAWQKDYLLQKQAGLCLNMFQQYDKDLKKIAPNFNWRGNC